MPPTAVDSELHIRPLVERDGLPIALSRTEVALIAARNGTRPVQRVNCGYVLPPYAGSGLAARCCHCGVLVGENQNLAAHAIAAFEEALHPETGEPLRLVVRHCDACRNSESCSRDATPLVVGHVPDAPYGWCEYFPQATSADAIMRTMFLPLPPSVLDLMADGFRRGARWIEDLILRIHTSQGQQIANLTGTTGCVGYQDSTSGHSFNAGVLRFLTGAAEATGNLVESGSVLVDVPFPNPWTGAASTATPSVLTANSISPATITGTGTAGHCRWKEASDDGLASTTERRYVLSVSTTSGDVVLNTLSLVSAGSITPTSFTVTHGA